ncbi:MAG: cation diffusion facilitator family transporter [Synergistaceae bacterium]|jgi:cation diffusion facilitator family transporter|nr:cation diffusion facilitator family transporter [Synergistaceae bacterium]
MTESSMEMNSVYPERRTRRAMAATLTGLWVNVLLTVGKYAAGILGHSGAMVADATHSLSDLLTDFAVLLGLRYTNRPADAEHAYGHGRFETLAAAFCGLTLLTVGLGVLVDGVGDVLHIFRGERLQEPGMIAMAMALVSIGVKEILYRYTRAEARRLNSSSLEANAWHHRSDALSSIGALLGIGGSILGGRDWAVLDPAAAIIVSFFILYAAITIFWNSIREVLDTSLAPAQLEGIRAMALDFQEIHDIHKIRTRRIGFYVALEAHIVMNGEMTLKKAHDITSALEKKLQKTLGIGALITLHMEPREF